MSTSAGPSVPDLEHPDGPCCSSTALPTHKLGGRGGLVGGSTQGHPVVLVSCGSFNPPTIMHLRMFELAADELVKRGYTVLGGYMSPVGDAYAKPGLASARHRLEMCQRACHSSDWVMTHGWEAYQPGYTRTLVVLSHIQGQLKEWSAMHQDGQGQAVQVMLLCGADVLASMERPGVWRDPDMVLEQHGAVCVAREGTDLEPLLQTPGGLINRFKDRAIVVHDHVGNSISSTAVRQELAAGRSIKYLVPDEAMHHILEHSLYSA